MVGLCPAAVEFQYGKMVAVLQVIDAFALQVVPAIVKLRPVAEAVEERQQPVVDQVVLAGIKAILNFSPGALKVPPEVKLKSVDLTVSLESLSFYLAQGEASGS